MEELEQLKELKAMLIEQKEKNEAPTELDSEGYSKVLLPPGVKANSEDVEPIKDNYTNKAFVNVLVLGVLSFVFEALFLLIAYLLFIR